MIRPDALTVQDKLTGVVGWRLAAAAAAAVAVCIDPIASNTRRSDVVVEVGRASIRERSLTMQPRRFLRFRSLRRQLSPSGLYGLSEAARQSYVWGHGSIRDRLRRVFDLEDPALRDHAGAICRAWLSSLV